MGMGIVLFVVCAVATLALWWVVVALIARRGHIGWWRPGPGRSGRLRQGPWRRPKPRPTTPGAPPTATPKSAPEGRMTLEWADRAQMWPALNAENALLAARIAGRLSMTEYRSRIADLARRCEPHSAADSE